MYYDLLDLNKLGFSIATLLGVTVDLRVGVARIPITQQNPLNLFIYESVLNEAFRWRQKMLFRYQYGQAPVVNATISY